jgi:hypothetical protein
LASMLCLLIILNIEDYLRYARICQYLTIMQESWNHSVPALFVPRQGIYFLQLM